MRHYFSPKVIIGGPGSDACQFNAPQGIAVDNWGNLYVADTNNHRIQKVTPYGDVYRFEESGRAPGQIMYPMDVAVDSLLSAYVLDAGNTRVQKFGPTWRHERTFGMRGPESGCFRSPESITRDAFNHIYVADTGNARIQKFAANGLYQLQVPGMSADVTQFRPTAVAIDQDYNIHVADAATDRIVVFNSRGGSIKAFGGTGSEPGQLSQPSAIEIGPDGTIFVAEIGNARLQAFDPSGECLAIFGGLASSGVEISEPRGLAVDADSNVYVVDARLHRVTKFAWV